MHRPCLPPHSLWRGRARKSSPLATRSSIPSAAAHLPPSSPSNLLAQFLRVCAESFAGTGLRSTAPAVRELLEAFGDVSAAAAESGAAAGDPSTPAGAISLGTLRHLLCEVLTPSSLSLQEATDLFRMTGLMPGGLSGPQAAEHLQRLPVDARDARRRAAEDGGAKPQLTTVDAEELISLLCYASPTGAPASKPAAAV